MKKYNEMFNTETFQLDWERVYSLPFKITVDTKWREFQYKILHRICYRNVTFKFGLAESPLRYFCNEELETLEHFLFHCERFNTFWNELNTILNPGTYKQIHTPTVVQRGGGGRGMDGTLPPSFRYVAVFWNDFTFSGKPLIFLTSWDIFYGWSRCGRPVTSPTMVAILDFTKNWKSG